MFSADRGSIVSGLIGVLVLSLFLAFPIQAQQFGDQKVITTSAEGARSVHAQNLGGEADADVLSASELGDKIAWYENQRSSDPLPDSLTFMEVNLGLTDVKYSSADWGDYDGDGDLDLVVAGTGGLDVGYTTTIYENQNDSDSSFVMVGADVADVREGSMDWGDYDDDGDLDLVITGRISTLGFTAVIYENQGGEFIPIDAGLTDTKRGSSDWGDYDGDGDLDLVITGTGDVGIVPDETATIYENRGEGEFDPIEAGLNGVERSSSDWGDYDGDGDLDLIIVGSTGVFNDATIYENQGDESFVAIEAGLTGVKNGSSDWGDYDGDGDLDVVITGSETAALYENQGDGSFEPVGAGLTELELSSSDWGDYDGDVNPDLIVTGVDSNSDTNTTIYKNQGGGSFAPAGADLTGVWIGSSDWGDYDGDGDLDLIVTGEDGVGAGSGGSPSTTLYKNLSTTGDLNPPTGLGAAQSDCQISLSWDENPSSNLSGYNVYRSSSEFSSVSNEKKIKRQLD